MQTRNPGNGARRSAVAQARIDRSGPETDAMPIETPVRPTVRPAIIEMTRELEGDG